MASDTDSFDGDLRAVTITDGIAVGVLLGFTVLMAAGLGVSVFFSTGDQADDTINANFSYQYNEQRSELLVTYKKGDNLTAGSVLLSTDDKNATWANVTGSKNSTVIEKGTTALLSPSNAYGRAITTSTTLRIYWTGGNGTGGNGTVKLDEWSDSGGF